jgi:predicted dienelactone hydrolase
MNTRSRRRRLIRGFAILSIGGLAAILLLLGLLWVERNTKVTLPAPTGPFAVGRTLFDWVDDETLDALAPVPGTKRELLVWIWYPADKNGKSQLDGYVPASLNASIDRLGPPLVFRLLTRDLTRVRGHSLLDPDVAGQQRTYPVVIMRGGASSPVLNYSTLAEDLASHGYVVVGFDAPYRTFVVAFSDGRVIERSPENNPELASGEELVRRVEKLLSAWTADCVFALNRLERLSASNPPSKFAGRLDLARVGVFGHSFGGATAAQLCAHDARVKAGIDIDGALHGAILQEGIQKPFMFLLSDHGNVASDPEARQIMGDIQSTYERLPAEARYLLTIHGANHFTFSDDGAILKSGFVRGMFRMTGLLGIDGTRQLAVTAHCVHSFFDVHLKGINDPGLKRVSSEYPELRWVN